MRVTNKYSYKPIHGLWNQFNPADTEADWMLASVADSGSVNINPTLNNKFQCDSTIAYSYIYWAVLNIIQLHTSPSVPTRHCVLWMSFLASFWHPETAEHFREEGLMCRQSLVWTVSSYLTGGGIIHYVWCIIIITVHDFLSVTY